MKYTESEAREKSCPFQDRMRSTKCIASECMMWKWYKLLEINKNKGKCGLLSTLKMKEYPM